MQYDRDQSLTEVRLSPAKSNMSSLATVRKKPDLELNMQHDDYEDRKMLGLLLSRRREALSLVQRLSPREKITLEFIVRGFSNKQIARELGLSPRTVEIYRANGFEKINARTTADAVRIGVYAGLDAEI